MNHVSLKGNLTREPELKTLPSGAAVAEFTVATSEVWYNDKKEKQERTHFIGCVAWGKTGENIAKYFGKGMPILVEGSLSQETWEKDGQKRERTKIKVTGFDFCGGEKKESASTSSGQPARLPAKPAADPDLDGDDSDDVPF